MQGIPEVVSVLMSLSMKFPYVASELIFKLFTFTIRKKLIVLIFENKGIRASQSFSTAHFHTDCASPVLATRWLPGATSLSVFPASYAGAGRGAHT